MIGFPVVLLVVGLLAVAFCLLREHGYLDAGMYPRNLGGFAAMTNHDQTRGWRLQVVRYPDTLKWFLVSYYPPFLEWPATWRFVAFRHVSLHLYLGSKRAAR